MKFCFRIGLYLNLLFFTSYINAQFNPLKDPEICGRPTCEPINKFNYTTEVNYRYQYTVDIRTLFAGSSKNESKLFINSHVSVEFLSPCEGILLLSDLKLSEEPDKYDREEDIDIESPQHDHSELFNEAISKYPIRFSYHNGVIGELCPEEDELNWVLNFKRGVLSIFQNTMYRFDMDHSVIETDVNGVCSTKYNVLESRGSSLVIEKIKDIDTCQSRYKHHSILQTTPYVYKSAKNDIPIMKSISRCELSVDHSIYNQITCTETHLFKPFSKHESGATTVTTQKLLLLGEERIQADDRSYVRRRTSLLYDHIPTPKPTTNELREARDMIKKMCVYSQADLQTEFSHAFANFINVARHLTYMPLSAIYTRGESFCKTGRKHVMDALPFLGSDAAVELMKDIILRKQISDDLAKEWMFSLAFIPRPTIKMLEVMLPLIEHESGDAGFPLSAASMVHSYCRWYPDCESESTVQHLISSFENIVNKSHRSKFKNRVTQEKILSGIKSLGNIGIISDTFKDTLHEIIDDNDLPIETRVAGIEAHRRFVCGDNENYFMNIYRNFDMDVEIRIAAYLQVMRCPNYLIIQDIKFVLRNEEVNQVGSFVWTHLNNLLKSSLPTRVEIQGLLSDKELGRKFNSDVRKFSNNFEKSVFFEEYNAGGSFESNVIFSSESYIPRRASLNLTVDLFGESINLLEVDSRIEGFEQYFESIFGPNRTFSPNNIKNKLLNLRPFRSADNKSITKSQINNIPNVLEDNFKSPKASLGLKIFGNELKYNTFIGNEEIFAGLDTLNPVTHIKRLLSGKEISYEKAAVLLDTSYIVPTGAGLPVTLNAAGIAAINLKMRGALRSAEFMNTGEMDIEGYFKPSIAIDITGSMTVDAYYASTGIKVKTNLYTSTDILGTVNVRFPRSISVEFKLPKNKTEIFGAQSELIVMKNDVEEYQTYIEKENEEENSTQSSNIISETSCSWPILDKVIGLKLCSSYKVPNVSTSENSKENMFFHGPTKFRLYIEKADPTAEIYIMKYKWKTENKSHKFSLIYDTPNSEINRMISANLTIDLENQNVSWLLKSTDYVFSAQGTFVNTDDEKMINLTFDINGKKHFSSEIGYKKTPHKYGFTYYPKFFLGVNDERIAELNGTLKWITKKNATQCDVNLQFDTKKLRTKLIGYISISDITVAMNLKLDYKFEKGNNEIVRLEGFVKYERRGTIFVHGFLQLTSTAYPQFNFISSLKYQKAAGHIECKLEINNGPDLKDDNHKLTLLFVFSIYREADGTKFNTHLVITKPVNQLDMKFEIEYERIQHKTNARILIKYAKDRIINISLFLSLPQKTFFYLEGKLNVTLPTFTPMVLDVHVDQKTSRKYNIDIKSTWFSGHSLIANGIYQDRSTVNSNNHHIKLSIKSPSFNDITVDGIYSQDDLEFKAVITANHNDDVYSILLKHLTEEKQPLIVSYGEIKYKHKMFSALSVVDLKDKQQIVLELHLDQIRDIYILLKSVNLPKNKFLGGEIKWDSNRDPNQKLAVSVEYFKHESYNTTGILLFSYPGRTVKGEYNFALKDTLLRSSGIFAWSSKDIISLAMNADYKHEYSNTVFLINSELLTPFETWEKASLNGGIQRKDNLYNISGSIYWRRDEYIAINLHTDYAITASNITGEFLSSIKSTISDIPSVSLSLKHRQNEAELDDKFYFMYHPEQIIALNSTWKIQKEDSIKILTGTVSIQSPYENCRKGILVSKFTFTKDMDIKGYAEFDVDSRKYTGLCEGRLKRILDSKFDFNITTPIEKHKTIIGRFGLNEDERHLVAEIKSTSSAVGIEILLQVNNIIDFDVLFNIATPIDFLKNALIVGKLKNEATDFRLGWNNLLIGFAGRWRYENLKDFDYAYKLYTPLEGIEENGVVARFILNEGLDMDISVSLAKSRLGIIILGIPNRHMLESLGVPPPQPILLEEKPEIIYSDEDEEVEELEIDWTSYVVDVKMDTVIYPTMTGHFDFNKIDTTYILISTINIPPGTINLREELRIDDYINHHNRIQIRTPFTVMKEITSRYDLTSTLFKSYSYIIDFCYKNDTKWVKTGIDLYYNKGTREIDDVDIYNGKIQLVTPFEALPHITITGQLEMDDNNPKTNISLMTKTTDIAIAGSLENDEGFLESWIHLKMVSPHLIIPPTLLSFRKDFSEVENSLQVGCVLNNDSNNSYSLEFMWKLPEKDNIRKGRFKIITPLTELKIIEIYGLVDRNKNDKSGSMTINAVYNEYFFKLNGLLNNNIITADIESFIEPYRKVNMEFTQQIDEKQKNIPFKGYIKTERHTHLISGFYEMNGGIPVIIKFNPGSPIAFEYELKQIDNGYLVQIDFEENELKTAFNLSAKIESTNRLNWILSIETRSSSPKLNKIEIETEMKGPDSNDISLDIQAKTTIPHLENIELRTNIIRLPEKSAIAKVSYVIQEYKGNVITKATWNLMRNMKFNFITEYNLNKNNTKHIASDVFYVNKDGNFKDLQMGVDLNVDKDLWTVGSNITIHYIKEDDIDLEFNIKLPKPNADVHKLIGKYHKQNENRTKLTGLLAYFSSVYYKKYGVSGIVSSDGKNIDSNLKIEWGYDKSKSINNIFNLTRVNEKRTIINYHLDTPKYKKEDTFVTKIILDNFKSYHALEGKVYFPASNNLLDTKINYKDFTNMNGTINSTIQILPFKYIGIDFITETKPIHLKRYAKIFWPNNTAIFNSIYTYTSHFNDRSGKGKLIIEIPLATRHIAITDYGYEEKRLHKTGYAVVNYNKKVILNGTYNCESEQRAGFEKDIVTIEMENQYTPVGILYIHQTETEPIHDGFTPTFDIKRAELYKLHSPDHFNVTGEIHVRSTISGQIIHLTAHHINRTVTFDTDYDILDQQFLNKAKLQLAKDIWLAYDLNLLNNTVDDTSEAQQVELKISHPVRNITILGSYNISEGSLSSGMILKWNNQTKIKNIEAALDWKQLSTTPNHQQLIFELKHPTFEKNVTFIGEYYKDKKKLGDVKLSVEYSNDPNRRVDLSASLQNNSHKNRRNYTFEFYGTHPDTSLDVAVKSGIFFYPKYYHTTLYGKYKSLLSSLEYGDIFGTLDLTNHEVEFNKKTRIDLTYFWSKYNGEYPLYRINGSGIYGHDINATGEFYLNMDEKIIKLEVNVTPDASQTINMYGIIPDTRTALFNFWRDYDDIRVSDISYFIRLNHSRLITSKLLWRPNLKSDIKTSIKELIDYIVNSANNNIEFWKKMIPSKTEEALTCIWHNAEEYVEGFVNDTRNLNVLEQDIEKFKLFLNETYNNNEFYIQNITSVLQYIIEELSVRRHIESVPDIINEIWEIMGESGQSLRKSFQWLIEAIKEAYKKATEFSNSMMKGEGFNQISQLMKYFVEKYDKFMKDLHVAFIKYMEKLWGDANELVVVQWNKMLQAITPTYLKFIHYLETIIWKASKEFLDFLYERKTEIVGSPYFNQFSNFTHDVDRFYKDITNHSIIYNVNKYSEIVRKFLIEKYFQYIPFSKELSDLYNEIIEELEELKKLPSVQFALQKYDEVYRKVKWFYDYFEIEERVQKIITILHLKMTQITQTALESENKYREAKTKFIFDPESGVLELEQKLPMSWHSFNDSMQYGEIPEIKMLHDLQNYFISSNKTFWTMYYEYKPYTEPTTWLPPFDAYALIAGPQHFITFDGKHYDFIGTCTYLLAHDFKDGNFSIMVQYGHGSKSKTHNLYILVDDALIQIDLFTNNVKLVKDNYNTRLPLNIGGTFVYQENDIITVESNYGFTLKCNLVYNVCKMKLSGWYYGRTAGLWGTMNNEPRDDMLFSTNKLDNNTGKFAQSWSIDPKKCRSTINHAIVTQNFNEENKEPCDSLFKNKVSQFSACFPIVDPTEYYNMCLTSEQNTNNLCIAASAYIEACSIEHTPLRIPDACVKCNLVNGTDVEEGLFINFNNSAVPQSADIVFIVEAKKCNANITTERNINSLISFIHKELIDANLTSNRYSLVVFGGSGVFNKPRSIVSNNNVFTTHQMIPRYFENIPIGNGSSDIFEAISYASKLIFRPAVSKTFILLPCTECDATSMELDYNVLHQLLRERDITLHILMNGDFVLPKARDIKILYGIDSETSYTKKDTTILKGDVDLKRQVKLPKAILGYCTALALETNGTVFTAKKLENKKRNAVKKFSIVFAKRVVKSAKPNSCQTCECTASDTRSAFMECYPCTYPNIGYVDYGFTDEFTSIIHTTDDMEYYEEAYDYNE